MNCSNCGRPAEVNVQKLWVKWNYYNDIDEYSSSIILDDQAPDDSENIFFCKKCFAKWERGEL